VAAGDPVGALTLLRSRPALQGLAAVLPSTFVLLTTLPGAPFLLATLLLIAALGTAAVTR
jgi:hypothetical protein